LKKVGERGLLGKRLQSRAVVPALRHSAFEPRSRARLCGNERPGGICEIQIARPRRIHTRMDYDAVDLARKRRSRSRRKNSVRARKTEAQEISGLQKRVKTAVAPEPKILEEKTGDELIGWEYEPLYPYLRSLRQKKSKKHLRAYKIYPRILSQRRRYRCRAYGGHVRRRRLRARHKNRTS
jgi:hypothetical protein